MRVRGIDRTESFANMPERLSRADREAAFRVGSSSTDRARAGVN